MIILREGDLFKSPQHSSLAHCISADAKMSKGIALQFMRHFPELSSLRKEKHSVGVSVVVNIKGRLVYNLITKQRFYMKPSLSSIKGCLQSMLNHATKHGIKDISVPKLASGCDKMNFNSDVLPLLESVFGDNPVNIHVYCKRYVLALYIVYSWARLWNSYSDANWQLR